MTAPGSETRRWTILDLLNWTTERFQKEEIESARLDAEVLLAHCLNVERLALYLQFDRPLDPSELSRYRTAVKRRLAREPVAYITGAREFFSLAFAVDERVLVPRPETELLVEIAVGAFKGQKIRAADIGTGSGAIAAALATEIPGATVLAGDIDDGALAVAKQNVDRHGLADRVRVDMRDVLNGIAGGSLDLVVSNPPYLTDAEYETAMPEVSRYEPRIALAAGADGLDVIRRLVPDAFRALKPGGRLLFEIGAAQGDAASQIARGAGFDRVTVHSDLAGLPRVVDAAKER